MCSLAYCRAERTVNWFATGILYFEAAEFFSPLAPDRNTSIVRNFSGGCCVFKGTDLAGWKLQYLRGIIKGIQD